MLGFNYLGIHKENVHLLKKKKILDIILNTGDFLNLEYSIVNILEYSIVNILEYSIVKQIIIYSFRNI